jgi:hypothetical protein
LFTDYGSSFPDVVRGLVHALEALCSNNSSLPSNFKQKGNLEKQVSVIDAYTVALFARKHHYLETLLRSIPCFFLQLTFTALHLLGFVSPNDDPSLKDFLIKVRSLLLSLSR